MHRQAPAAMAAAIVALAIASVPAQAAPLAKASASSKFCDEAQAFGKSSVSSTLLTLPPATIKADYAEFKAAQPSMEAAAPSSIKADLKKIFVFDDGIFVDLSKSGWSVAKLSPADLKTLEVNGPKLKPAVDKVTAYLDKTCGLKLPLP